MKVSIAYLNKYFQSKGKIMPKKVKVLYYNPRKQKLDEFAKRKD